MCSTCGCGDEAGTRVTALSTTPDDHSADAHVHPHDHSHPPDHPHDHSHVHDHGHALGHGHGPEPQPQRPSRTVVLEQEILAKNDLLAAHNRGWLAGRGITALNVMSSPGSGKTTLLVRTINEMSGMPGAPT